MPEEIPARGSLFGKCLPARYVLAILGSIGMGITYGLKVNLSVTMVAMLNHTAIAEESPIKNDTLEVGGDEDCQGQSGGKHVNEDGPFTWDEPLQGDILSSYFWGYIVSQYPGAFIAENYSAKWVMFGAVGINVIGTLLTPPLTIKHWIALIVLRVLEGIGGGFTIPAMHCMISAWAPPYERSIISSIVYVGASFGTLLSILLSGLICNYLGWEWVFYVMGGLSVIWMLLWLILIQDNPNKQRFISPEEREMILGQLGTSKRESPPPAPWKKILSSIPFWAILLAHFCSNFGWYMFLIEIPFYMKQVLKFNVKSNAAYSSFPYLTFVIFSLILGKILDTLRFKQTITTTTARKVATAISSVIPSLCLLGMCLTGCKYTAIAVILMTIGISSMGAMLCGFLMNHIDIAPNYAGTLVALTNTVATIPGILVPISVGYITKGNQTIDAWRIIFIGTVILLTIGFLGFSIFASGEEQPWNKQDGKKNED